jgi:hypothetical protein
MPRALLAVVSFVLAGTGGAGAQSLPSESLYRAAPPGVNTRWVSPENPTGAPGAGGRVNRGAKGAAFVVVAPGERKTLFEATGAGLITRIWMSGNIPRVPELRRAVRIDMYWDGASTPAVSAPVGDFFGVGLGELRAFESALFASPEGRSYNAFIPMPYRTGARIEITNESRWQALIWYDVNALDVPRHAPDVLYFHAHWRREERTRMGHDFEILPPVRGRGRYVGVNVGVIGNEAYRGTWFGEGEVKIYLDRDREWPTLVGTGTEDYVGSGWGQGEYAGQFFGSVISDDEKDRYAFYRYHLPDPVFFHEACRITLQQIGNAPSQTVRNLIERGVPLTPTWALELGDRDVLRMRDDPVQHLFREGADPAILLSDDFPHSSTSFYRDGDDLSSTVYFYLDRPENGLPSLPDVESRLRRLPASTTMP